jgi:hypothetical protein
VAPGGLAPEVSIAPNGFSYGSPASLGRQAYPDEDRVELADTWTLTRGRHQISAGGDWSRVHDRIASVRNAEGTFLYDSGTTNGRDGGLADWITDYTFNVHAYPNGACPSIVAADHLFCFRSYTQSFGGAESEFVTHELAGFGEDTMRLPHGLTLTLGARYEYLLLPVPQQPNPALDAVLAQVDSQIVSPQAGSTSVFPEDRNNIGPRAGIAWAPRGRSLTFRLGYGVFYGRVPGATLNAALTETALPSSTRRIRIVPSTTTLCPQVADQGFGYPCAYTTEPPAAVAQTSSATVFARSFRLPAVQRATFSAERTWKRGVFVRVSYAMANATQLPQSVDLNIAPAMSAASFVIQGGDGHTGLRSGQTFQVPLYTARRSSAFGPVSALVSHANATYHSATAETRLRAGALELRGSYTFARAIDYAPQVSATPRLNGQFDPFADGYDKGLSSLDFRHRFSGDLVLHTQMRRGPEALRRTVSGWQLASIATAGSGAPYSYAIFGGTELSGGRETINGSGGATYLPTIGRNTLRLPARSAVDLRLARSFSIRRETRLSAFAEAFNLLNTRSLSHLETRAFLLGTPAYPGAPTPLIFQDAATIATEGLTTPAFGTPTSSISGLSRERQIELGVRLAF